MNEMREFMKLCNMEKELDLFDYLNDMGYDTSRITVLGLTCINILVEDLLSQYGLHIKSNS